MGGQSHRRAVYPFSPNLALSRAGRQGRRIVVSHLSYPRLRLFFFWHHYEPQQLLHPSLLHCLYDSLILIGLTVTSIVDVFDSE